MKVLRENKFAQHKYSIERKFEAGLVLKGSQVKDIRSNNYELREAIVREVNNEIFLFNVFPHSTGVKIKLLLNRNEVSKILSMMKSKKNHGFILNLHLNDKNIIKADIGVGIIKKKSDRKSSEKRSSEKRDFERNLKEEYYY